MTQIILQAQVNNSENQGKIDAGLGQSFHARERRDWAIAT
jgi:hypothetical protein